MPPCEPILSMPTPPPERWGSTCPQQYDPPKASVPRDTLGKWDRFWTHLITLPAIMPGEGVKYFPGRSRERILKQDPHQPDPSPHHLPKEPNASPSPVLRTHQPSATSLHGSLLMFPSQTRANIFWFEDGRKARCLHSWFCSKHSDTISSTHFFQLHMWNELAATSTPHMLLAPLGVFHKLLMVRSGWMSLFVPSTVTLQNLSYPSK